MIPSARLSQPNSILQLSTILDLGYISIFGCLLHGSALTVMGPQLSYISLGCGIDSVCGSNMPYQVDALARVPYLFIKAFRLTVTLP